MKTVTLDVRAPRDAMEGFVTALLNAGILDRADGGIVFPFEAIKVEFVLQAA